MMQQVQGAPFQPGDLVRVVAEADEHDLSTFMGRLGFVECLEYDCGCGQHYPDDPMIRVKFAGSVLEEFWREELKLARRAVRRGEGETP